MLKREESQLNSSEAHTAAAQYDSCKKGSDIRSSEYVQISFGAIQNGGSTQKPGKAISNVHSGGLGGAATSSDKATENL